MSNRPVRALAYVRLSRDDIKGPGATEEKLAARARQCIDLAARHNLPLDPADILIERESGTTLARSQMQRLLDLARSGQITHVVTPYQDRLSRGNKRDIQEIEDALAEGGVTLVTSEGVVTFDDDFEQRHGLVWDVRGAVARAFVRDTVAKRKASDLERLKRNVRSRGYAPYGYRYIRPVRDGYGRVITPQAYEVIPAEYTILEELFRRIPHEGINKIVADLNRRQIPGPGVGRLKSGSLGWGPTSVRGIVTNPFYAGFYCQRRKVRRGKLVQMDFDDYILADEEGDWPHPVTLADWREVCDTLIRRRHSTEPRSGLLTGILHCPAGHPMRRDGTCYGCRCRERGEPHAGNHAGMHLDRWAGEVAAAIIDALPARMLIPRPKATATAQELKGRAQALVRDVQSRRERVQELMLRGNYFAGMFGPDEYEEACRRARSDLDTAQTQLAAVRAQLDDQRPDTRPIVSLKERIKALGFAAAWEELDTDARRALLRLFISRIVLATIPEGRKFYRSASVELRGWLDGLTYALPPFPVKTFPRKSH